MVRLIANNVKKILHNSFKGEINVHIINIDTMTIDIYNKGFYYHTVIDSVYMLMYNSYTSIDIANIISKEYRDKINELFFK